MKFLLIFILFIPISLFASEWIQTDDLKFPPQNLSARVVDISCPDSSNCYAFVQHTSEYLVKHSSDQGATWTTIYTADPDNEEKPKLLNLHRVCSPFKNYLFLGLYERAIIKKSTDGGATFKRIILDTLDTKKSRKIYTLKMYDTAVGFASSADFYYTTHDGWETFEKYNNRDDEGNIYSCRAAEFLDKNTIGAFYSFEGDEIKESMYKKYNIAENDWTELYQIPADTTPDSKNQNIFDFCFLNDTLGIACGSQSTGIGSMRYEIMFQTKDGGNTWQKTWKVLDYPKFGLKNISFHDQENGIVVGQYGSILYTKDAGNTWLRDTLPKVEGDPYGALRVKIAWAGQTPIIGTMSGGGLWRYEGDFFDFSKEDTSNPDVITEAYANVRVRVRNSDRSMYISIDDEQFRKYELKIFDINGHPKQTNKYQSGSGNVFRPVNIEGLKSGAYLYMVSSGGLPVRSGKFVVVR